MEERGCCSICGKRIVGELKKGLCGSCSDYYLIWFDLERQTITFGKEEFEKVVMAIIIATISKARPSPMSACRGEYRSKINIEEVESFIDSASKDFIFFVDYSHGRTVKTGMKKKDGRFILVDREEKPLSVKEVKMIIESANYYLDFIGDGERRFAL